MCSNLTQAVLISNDMKWEYVFQIQPGILGGANPFFFPLLYVLNRREK
jgi:hypothetical protein